MSAMLYTHTAEPLKMELKESNMIQSFTGPFSGHSLSTCYNQVLWTHLFRTFYLTGAADKMCVCPQGAYSQVILNKF